MFKKLTYNVPGYFAHRLTRQVKELYASVAIMDLAMAAVMIFEPIYLYIQGFSLQKILLFYIAVYIIYFFILPLGAKFARRFGYEKSILFSSPFLIFYYLSLFAIPYSGAFVYSAILMLALNKTFYWPGYHSDFARFSTQEERGREVSNLIILSSLVYIIGPLAGGIILTWLGFKTLFVVVSALILASNIPLLSTKEVFTPIPFSYKKAYRRLVRKENRRKFLAYLGFGEELIVLVIWPVFIYVVIKNFFSIGAIVAIATLITTIVVLYIGRVTDKKSKHSILRTGTFIYSLVWFLRLFVTSGLHVFFVDTLSRLSKNIIYVPLTTITYERAAKNSVMKSIIFFEMSLIVGKLISAFLVLGLSLLFPPGWGPAFVVAGLMTLLYGFL